MKLRQHTMAHCHRMTAISLSLGVCDAQNPHVPHRHAGWLHTPYGVAILEAAVEIERCERYTATHSSIARA